MSCTGADHVSDLSNEFNSTKHCSPCEWPYYWSGNDHSGINIIVCSEKLGEHFEESYTLVKVIWGILSVASFIFIVSHIVFRLSDRGGLFALARTVQRQVYMGCFFANLLMLILTYDPYGWDDNINVLWNLLLTDYILAIELTLLILVIVSWVRLVQKVGAFDRARQKDDGARSAAHLDTGKRNDKVTTPIISGRPINKKNSDEEIPYLWVSTAAIMLVWGTITVACVVESSERWTAGWQADSLKLAVIDMVGTCALFVGWFYGLSIYYFIRNIHGMHVESIRASVMHESRQNLLDNKNTSLQTPEKKVTFSNSTNKGAKEPLLANQYQTPSRGPSSRGSTVPESPSLQLAQHNSRQRELKLRTIVKFMAAATFAGVLIFVLTAQRIVVDISTQWPNFCVCAPTTAEADVISSAFIYIVEYSILVALLVAFREPTQRPRGRGRPQLRRGQKNRPRAKPKARARPR